MKTWKIFCRDRPNYIEWRFGDLTSLLEVPECIESPSFPFVGAAWHVKFDAHGGYSDSVFTSACLTREGAYNPEHCISGRIGIKREDGTEYVSQTFNHIYFNDIINYAPFSHLVARSDLKRDMLEIAPQDVMTFFCWMTTIDGESKEMETQTEPEVCNHTGRNGCEEVQCALTKGTYKLAEDVQDLFLNEKLCDTTIKVANREFQAHRLILVARSPVFASMYSHDTTERSTGIVEIKDCDPEVFQDFLIFLYSGKLESLSLKNAFGLYTVADKYDVQELKEESLKFMTSNLSVDHFGEVMALALKYNESELLKSTTDFFVENARNISVTSSWLCFHRDYPVESNELYIKVLERYVPKSNKISS